MDSLQMAIIPTSMLYRLGVHRNQQGRPAISEFKTKLSNVLESDKPPSTILEDSQPEQRCDEIEQKFNCADSQLLCIVHTCPLRQGKRMPAHKQACQSILPICSQLLALYHTSVQNV